MTYDGANTIVYDAEGRSVSSTNGSSSGAYLYDGNSLRVKRCLPNCTSPTTTTVSIFSGSKVIAEYDNGAAPASPSREYIYSGSQLLATIAGGATTYHHPDHLSVRVTTDSSGNVARSFGHFPFGEVWYETGTASKWKFTSYERDSESSNDYAMARFYRSNTGRFSSPDPLSGSALAPQSLNRYAYTINDPSNLSDPLGSDSCPPGTICVTSWGTPWPDGGGTSGGGSGVPDFGFGGGGGVPMHGLIQDVPDLGRGPIDDPPGPPSFLGPPPQPPLPVYCQPLVIEAMKKAFAATFNGYKGNEAGFAVNGSLEKPQVGSVTVGQDRGLPKLQSTRPSPTDRTRPLPSFIRTPTIAVRTPLRLRITFWAAAVPATRCWQTGTALKATYFLAEV